MPFMLMNFQALRCRISPSPAVQTLQTACQQPGHAFKGGSFHRIAFSATNQQANDDHCPPNITVKLASKTNPLEWRRHSRFLPEFGKRISLGRSLDTFQNFSSSRFESKESRRRTFSRQSQCISSTPEDWTRIPDAAASCTSLCGGGKGGLTIRSFASHHASGVSTVAGKGYSALRTSVKFGSQNINFFIVGVDPDEVGEGKKSSLAAIQAVKETRPDFVLLSLGHLDSEKMFETFSKDALLRTRAVESVEQVQNRANGQFILPLQHLLIHGIPYYLIGRDRLVEMGALGKELLWRPREFYALLWKLICRNKEKEAVSASLKQVLSEDSSEFCLLKLHQYLLEWTESKHSAPDPVLEFGETKFIEKWLIGRNKNECQLRMRAKQFELARLPLPENIKSKLHLKVLIICDVAMEERLAERLCRELPALREEGPRFARMLQLENTSSTRFHLCLMIYIILPLATLCRLLWKRAKQGYLEYWVKGCTVSVTGDEVISRLNNQIELNSINEDEKRSENLEIVEARWMGLRHSVRDKSRD